MMQNIFILFFIHSYNTWRIAYLSMDIEINTHDCKYENTLGDVIVLWRFIVFFCAAQFPHIAKYKLVLYQNIRVEFSSAWQKWIIWHLWKRKFSLIHYLPHLRITLFVMLQTGLQQIRVPLVKIDIIVDPMF